MTKVMKLRDGETDVSFDVLGLEISSDVSWDDSCFTFGMEDARKLYEFLKDCFEPKAEK
jgi:hypothetical protein